MQVEEKISLDRTSAGAKPVIVVGIPAYNEEKTIGKIVLQALRFANYVIVCDDGSVDLTADIAEGLGAEVIRHERNLGKGDAIKSLFVAGRRVGGDVFVTIDGDDQHEPCGIPKLVKPIMNGQADIVVGCRFSNGNHIPRRRRVGNHVLNLFTGISRAEVTDVQSGFRAYSRAALNKIDVTVDGFGVDSQILIDAKEKGIKVVEVPVLVKYPRDIKTSKKNILRHGSEVIVSLIELISERRPLLLLGFPGLLLFIVGSASFVMVLKIFNETRQFAIGTAILGVASALLGTLMVLAALILWVLGRRLEFLENRLRNRVHNWEEYGFAGD